jgi:predicted RNase H-like nuclease (RuvC/YqgF family)
MAVIREFDCALDFHGVPFHLEARYISDQLLTLSFVSPDFTERWYGEFTSDHIESVTHRAGAIKKLTTFWKMLCIAGTTASQSVSLSILVPSALFETLATASEDKIYIILTQISEFDQVRYPLRWRRTDFTAEELKATVRRLYAENLRLRERPALSAKSESGIALERKVAQLTGEIEQLQKEKDEEIRELERKLQGLSATAATTSEIFKAQKSSHTQSYERTPERRSPKTARSRKIARTPK